MKQVTKMLILDKYLNHASPNDWVLESELNTFVGKNVYVPGVDGEFQDAGKITKIELDSENETMKVNDIVSYYDDFDFDFVGNKPEAVYVLYVDKDAKFEGGSELIVREEWVTSTNTAPNAKALKKNGTLKLGTGIKGDYATVANDGVIELALVPAIPGTKSLGPVGSDGTFTKTEKGDISCLFGVTSLEHPLNDVLGLYDSITLDVFNDGELVQKVKLHEDGWYNEAGEKLEGTYIDENTIQEATRVSFLTEPGKEHKFVLSANTKEDNVSIEVTVIDEYVEPEPENPETPETEE